MLKPSAKTFLVIGAAAWAVGFSTYLLASGALWRYDIGDLVGLTQLSAVTFAAAYAFVYIPVMLAVRQSVLRSSRIWLFPLASAPLVFVATALVWLWLGIPGFLLGYGSEAPLSLTFFTSPETALFYWMFGVAGVIVGFAFALLRRPERI